MTHRVFEVPGQGTVVLPGSGPPGPTGDTGPEGPQGPAGENFPTDFPVVETETERDTLYGEEAAGFWVLVTDPASPLSGPHLFRLITPDPVTPVWSLGIAFNGAVNTAGWTPFFKLFAGGDNSLDTGVAIGVAPVICSLGGVLQRQDVDFTISGNNLIFTETPAAGISAFGFVVGELEVFGQPGENFPVDWPIVGTDAERDGLYGEEDAGFFVLVTTPDAPYDSGPHLFRLETPDPTNPVWSDGIPFGPPSTAPTLFDFTGDGSEDEFTLPVTPQGLSSILWFEDGVIQRPTTDYTLSGAVVTRTTAPENGAEIIGWVFP